MPAAGNPGTQTHPYVVATKQETVAVTSLGNEPCVFIYKKALLKNTADSFTVSAKAPNSHAFFIVGTPLL